jgi:hypothetical protein
MKSGINSTTISTKERLNLKNISSFNLSNYGDTDLIVTLNSVSEKVARFDTANDSAPSWAIDGDGTYSDIDLTIEFVAGSSQDTNKAIVRYRQVLTA